MPKISINNRTIINNLLNDAFPNLYFTEKNNIQNLDILNYINEADGEYFLDLVKMSKSEHFAHLFHEDFPAIWNEYAAKNQYGRADVIRFSLDFDNEKFLDEFSKLKNANKVNIGKDVIPNWFLDELDFYGDEKKPVWEEIDFSKIVKHKSPDIYKAFLRYAHRMYNLLGFGLWKQTSSALENRNANDLLLTGNKLLDGFIRKKILKINKLSVERQITIFEAEQEILESFQKVGKKYTPYLLMDIKTFIKQLKSGIYGLSKVKSFDNPDRVNQVETFNQGDRKNIYKYFTKIGQFISDIEDFKEYHQTHINGTYRDKVMFLFQWIGVIRKNFKKRELEIIYGLLSKLHLPVPLDEPLNNSDCEKSFSLYDILTNDGDVSSDEHLSWTALFLDVFKQEFDETQMKKFLECIPHHFQEYPLKYDDDEIFITMTKYSKKELYKTYCKIAGIEEEQEAWEVFLVMIQKVIDNINKIRKETRRRP